MELLITGAFGFVGTSLSRVLSTFPTHQLIGIDIKEPDHHIFDEFQSWDDLEKVDWSKADAIIHLV